MEDIKKNLEELLIKYNLIKYTEEIKKFEEELNIDKSDKENIDENDIGITSDGIRYNKKLVFQYLNERGYPFYQDYVEKAALLFKIEDDGKIKRTKTETITHTELENIQKEDISSYMQLKTIELLIKIQSQLEKMEKNQLKQYTIDVVYDNSNGGTNISDLNRSLEIHSRNGWSLKQIVANELGKNAHSVSIGSSTYGVNSTQDQLVLIYERPDSWNDKYVADFIK